MAASLAVFHEADSLQCTDDRPRSERGCSRHESGRDGHAALKEPPFNWRRLPFSGEAFEVKANCFYDITLGFLERFTLGVTARQCGNESYVTAVGGLFVVHRVRERSGQPFHRFIVREQR